MNRHLFGVTYDIGCFYTSLMYRGDGMQHVFKYSDTGKPTIGVSVILTRYKYFFFKSSIEVRGEVDHIKHEVALDFIPSVGIRLEVRAKFKYEEMENG